MGKLDKKVLQAVNLSPSESWIEKLTEVHPMTVSYTHLTLPTKA